MVLSFAKENQTPIVTTMSGGYALDINDTVEIHANTIRAVKKVFFGKDYRSSMTSAQTSSSSSKSS